MKPRKVYSLLEQATASAHACVELATSLDVRIELSQVRDPVYTALFAANDFRRDLF